MTVRRARRAVEDALNGDADSIDSAVRRGLFALTTELDEHIEQTSLNHDEVLGQLKGIRRLLITTSITFTVTLCTALLSALLR